jgi:hypothetical protein
MTDDGALHIDVRAMLKEMNMPDTPENREQGCKMVSFILRKMLKDTPTKIEVVE